jgi:hypothetical protein
MHGNTPVRESKQEEGDRAGIPRDAGEHGQPGLNMQGGVSSELACRNIVLGDFLYHPDAA